MKMNDEEREMKREYVKTLVRLAYSFIAAGMMTAIVVTTKLSFAGKIVFLGVGIGVALFVAALLYAILEGVIE